MKAHFNDLNGAQHDEAPIALPDLAGRTITSAELIHGTESDELVLLTGDDWHATIHHNQNPQGRPYLSAAFYQGARESRGKPYDAVSRLTELEGLPVERAESATYKGSAAIAIDAESGSRIVFVAGSEPGTIDIANDDAV